jgi:hypothetical protein
MMHRIRSLILRSALMHAPTALAYRKLCVMCSSSCQKLMNTPVELVVVEVVAAVVAAVVAVVVAV